MMEVESDQQAEEDLRNKIYGRTTSLCLTSFSVESRMPFV